MRLQRVQIRDFRSIKGEQPEFSIDVASGMTTVVGPNNCGKSNVLRAINLALNPQISIDPEIDIPAGSPAASPTIDLVFELSRDRAAEKKLLARLEKWEGMVEGAERLSDRNLLHLRVVYSLADDGGYVRNAWVLPVATNLLDNGPDDTGNAAERRKVHSKIVAKLFEQVQVVPLSTGQGLETFLAGSFRSVLMEILGEQLVEEREDAEEHRLSYIAGLESRLLEPLRTILDSRLRELFAEVGGLRLQPAVPDIERTIANMVVRVTDAVDTPLDAKGTGVRGVVLVALLSYLAEHSGKSLVLLLEEPEAFLHPRAQEDLRDTLEQIAENPDATLLVTSHSPFIASRRSSGSVVALQKSKDGATYIRRHAPGDSDAAHVIGDLIRPSTFQDVLAAARPIDDDVRGVVVVEGEGDKAAFERACRLCNRMELLADLEIRPANGAERVPFEAIIAKAALGDSRPVIVLVDNDDPGKRARDTLRDKFKEHFPGSLLRTVGDYLPSIKKPNRDFEWEAEGLYAPELIEQFVEHDGRASVKKMVQRPGETGYQYDFGKEAKERLEVFIDEHATAEQVSNWIVVLEDLRARMDLPLAAVAAASSDTPADEAEADAPEDRPAASPVEMADSVAPAAEDPTTWDPGTLPRVEDDSLVPLLQPDGDATEGNVLVLQDMSSWESYQLWSVVVLPVDVPLEPHHSHIGFYVHGHILPTVPAVKHRMMSLRVSGPVVERLKADPSTMRVAEVLDDLLGRGQVEVDALHHVLLLSPDDSGETLKLERSIENDLTDARGRRKAWTVRPRAVHLDSLTSGVGFTSELD